jgi:hypothetical protein
VSAPIEEIVFLLNSFDRKRLERLQKEFPEHAEQLLRPGIIAGATNREIKIRVATALEGIETIERICSRGLEAAGKRLQSASRLEFMGELVSLFGSSSAVYAAWQELAKEITGLSAGVALLGSLSAVCSKYLRRGIGNGHDISESYTSFSQAQPQAAELHRELSFLTKLPRADSSPELGEQVKSLVSRINELSKIVYEAASQIPGLLNDLKAADRSA